MGRATDGAGVRRRASGWRALTTAPWRRAPLLLARQPAVLAAVAFAGLILGAGGAATPLYESSVGSAALAAQVAQRCQGETGYTAGTSDQLHGRVPDEEVAAVRGRDGGEVFRLRDQAVRRAAARVEHVGEPVLTMVGQSLMLRHPRNPSELTQGRLLHRQGFGDHIQKLQAVGGRGIWVPAELAAFAGVRAGDRVTLDLSGRTAPVRVVGLYRDLNRLPVAPFWCSKRDRIYPAGFAQDPPPPPLLVTDPETMVALDRRLRMDVVEYDWELPLAGPLSLSQAREVARGFVRVARELISPGGTFSIEPGRFGLTAGRLYPSSELPALVRRSDGIVGAVRGAIGPVATAGSVVALLLVAAAGSYWADRRRREVAVLAAKGVGPGAVGVKAALEMVVPAALGVLAGWGLAILLVRQFGPSGLLDASAPWDALARAGIGLGAGVALLGVVAGLRARGLTERGLGAGPGWLARVPWELAVLALAAWSYQRLRAAGPPAASGTGVPRIDLLLLAFPLLFLTGSVALVVRGLGLVVPRLRTAGERWPHALYLAVRRLASSARLALLLLGAAAVSIGVLVYAATLTQSVRATLDAKAQVFLGGDVALQLLRDAPVPAGVRGTTVGRMEQVQVGGVPADVLLIDSASFARTVFWDKSFHVKPFDRLIGQLAQARPGAPVPVLAGDSRVPPEGSFTVRPQDGTAGMPVAYRVVDRVPTFPGMRANVLVVMDKRALGGVRAAAEWQLWARGRADQVQAAVQRDRTPLGGVVLRAEQVLDTTSFQAVAWTFGFLQSFGVLTGLITLAGLLLYLETRQRARKAAYLLVRRMGLSRAAHRLSVLAEVGGTLVGGCLAGMALSLVAARVVYGRLDTLPSVRPDPLLRTPVLVLLATGAAVVAAAWLGAWTAQRSADRGSAAEVLRHAE